MLEDRERDFEGRYAHDQEMRFRIAARRNLLAGRWAGAELGKDGEARESYAQSLIRVDYLHPAEHALFTKLRTDFDASGVAMSDHRIERHIAESLATAETQIMKE